MIRAAATRKVVILLIWTLALFTALFWPKLYRPMESQKPCLNIFSWSDIIPRSLLEDFEKETGIKVRLDYYSSNEELLVKLKNIKGKGYDLIIPSDYAVQILSKEGALKELKKEKLHFTSDLRPFLLNHDFDPGNKYSLPLLWDVYGFGIDIDTFKDQRYFTWEHLFNEDMIKYKIAMTNDPIEAFCLGAFYLFGPKASLTSKETSMVKRLLIEQKKHVEAYAVPRSDYIVGSKNASLALSLSSYVIRSKKHFPFMEFVIPQNKTFISIENVAIPANAKHEKEAYQFLNYIYEKENLAKACNSFEIFPATKGAIEFLENSKECADVESAILQKDYQLYFFRHLLPEKELRTLWIEIKAQS